jgi:hypothetical protein
MEKRNVVEKRRTPCIAGKSRFCECPKCEKALHKKQAAENTVDIRDTEALARLHK